MAEHTVDSNAATTTEKLATIPEVLAEVGDDRAKAQAALDAEQARGEDARSSLVEKLEALVRTEAVRVQLLVSTANHNAGDIVEVDEDTAERLRAHGQAFTV